MENGMRKELMDKLKSQAKYFKRSQGGAQRLSDESLDQVNGGFQEWEDLASKGWEITCGSCGSSNWQDFSVGRNSSFLGFTEYTCNHCGFNFVMDGQDGGYWPMEAFKILCRQEGLNW